MSKDDIVISGISGRYSEANNVEEFWQKLINGHELYSINDERWPPGYLGLPIRTGRVQNASKFDAEFFNKSQVESDSLDPQYRIMHEVIYEAIYDAGIIPERLKGSKTAFLMGCCYDDTAKTLTKDVIFDEKERVWCSEGAVVISKAFGFTGAAYEIDTACASSFSCLNEGYRLMQAGYCDNLVIGGGAIQLTPGICVGFMRMRMISPDGRSKCLDEAVDGYCRSEAVVALFLQRRSQAKRIYASLLCCYTNTDGFKTEGITFPRYDTQKKLLKRALKESKIDPHNIEYIEAHVTGTAAGDPIESKAILDSYRHESKKPILFGCLKSNMGHTEGASANCAITKVALIFQKHCIPPNLNFKKPNPNIEGLIQKQIIPVIEKRQFHGDIIPVNSFGFGGVNVHALLKANEKVANEYSYKIIENIPRLVNICGRTEEGVNKSFEWIQANRNQVTKEFLSLLNDVSKIPLENGMFYRGYAVLDESAILKKGINREEKRKQLWFMFSEFDSNWKKVVKELMNLKPFADSLYKSAFIAKTVNIDLMHFLLDEHDANHVDTSNLFVSAVSVQIALTDVLSFLGLKPDGVFGFSVGEIVAAYADNCLTAKEAILIAYHISKCISKPNLMRACIGLNWKQAEQQCPAGVYLSCDVTDKHVVVTGAETEMKPFLSKLKEQKILVHELVSYALPLHCHLMNDYKARLNSELNGIINEKKRRSQKWVNISNESNDYCNEEYFVQNAISPFNLREMSKRVPEDACIIEILPSMIDSFISLFPRNNCIQLIKHNSETGLMDISTAIGEIYNNGHNPEIEKLYSKVEYPVPRETASLSHLLKWDHSKNYFVAKHPEYFNLARPSMMYEIDFVKEGKFIEDHCIDGRNLFPATGYLYYAWLHFSARQGLYNVFDVPVEFKNVHFHRAVMVQKGGSILLELEIEETCQKFCIRENGKLCVSGFISSPKTTNEFNFDIPKDQINDTMKLETKEIYKELRVRGYDYGQNFQGLIEASFDGSRGRVKWTGHWISFTDSMLHLAILSSDNRNLRVPTFIEYMKCDPKVFFKAVETEKELNVVFDKQINVGYSKGVIVKGLKVSTVARRQENPPVLVENIVFFPYSGIVQADNEFIKLCDRYFKVCCNTLQNLVNKNYDLAEDENLKNFSDPLNKEYALYQKLKQALNEKKEVKEFLESLTKEDKRCFAFESSVEELIKYPVSTVLENACEKVLKIVEYNLLPTNTNEDKSIDFTLQEQITKVVIDNVMKCDYLMVQPSVNENTLPAGLSNVYLIVIEDYTTKLLTTEDELEKNDEQFVSMLNSCYNALKTNGFLLCHFRRNLTAFERELFTARNVQLPKFNFEKNLKNNFEKANFRFISEKSDAFGMVSILLRKNEDQNIGDKPTFIQTDLLRYEWVETIKSELKQKGENKIWIKANANDINGVLGLTRCLRREPQGERIRCIISDEEKIPKEILDKDLAINVLRNGAHGAYFAQKVKEQTKEIEHAFVDVKTKGDLTSFKWFEAPHKHWFSLPERQRIEDQLIVYLYYSSLNFKDVMVASGRISSDAYPNYGNDFGNLGFEYSGIDENGNRVCGFHCKNAISTSILTSKDFIFSVPNFWTLEEAATVPVVYVTVIYGLFERAQLKEKETILIHAGSGGVGQAAIHICLSMGCEVFTSVGTDEKKEFLKSLYPQLKDKHFVNSRDLNFEEHILKETNGRGVDVILNSLAEEKLRASVNCLAEYGRFVEVGKYDLMQNNPFDPSKFGRNQTFHVVCVAQLMDQLLSQKNALQSNVFKKVMTMVEKMMKSGEIKPLRRTVFNHDQTEEAFRFMANGKHIGKVLIKIRDEAQNDNTPTPITMKAIPQTYCHPCKVYILVGGLGGIGLELAYWLVKHGAQIIVLTSRVGVKNNYQKFMIQKMESEGAKVNVEVNDTSTYELSRSLLQNSQKLGPIGGIFNLALVLSDALIENQTVESFEKVCVPKVHSTLYLDQISRQMCSELDYFVCFSSVAVRGNAGQSNYGFANSVMESICEKRRKDGLNGIAVQWGAVGDVGFVVENYNMNEIVIRGTLPQRISSCMNVLDLFMNSTHAIGSSIIVFDNRNSSLTGKGDLLKTICHVLGVKDPSTLQDNTTIGELGMDSLMAVEIQQALERDFSIVMTTQEIRKLTVKDIRELSAKKSMEKTDENCHDSTDEMQESDAFKLPEEVFVKLESSNYGVPMFFIPPVEGNFKLMKPLARYVTRPVVGLNWVEEVDKMSTIEEVAAFYVKKLREEYPQPEYDFVAYSFGSLIAFEICIQLQRVDPRLVKKLVILEGDQSAMKVATTDIIQCENKITKYSDLLVFFVSLFYPFEAVERFKKEILTLSSKDEQKQKAVELIKFYGKTDCSPDLLMATVDRYVNKVKLIHTYCPSAKFKGEVKMICATNSNGMVLSNVSAKDHEMQKLIDGNFEIISKTGDHKTFLTLNKEEIGNFIESFLYYFQS